MQPPRPARRSTPTSTAARSRYNQTISYAIDQLIEKPVQAASTSLPRALGLVGGVSVEGYTELTCDCCQLLVGLVQMITTVRGNNYTPKVVCAHCLSLYKLCNECGGGGGRLR